MVSKPKFLNQESTLAWLAQFAPDEQLLMRKMLRKMRLVSRDEFIERLIETIIERGKDGPCPVGLYAERELRHQGGKPHRLFKESRNKVKRAFGVGPAPVAPVRAYDSDVGSEGLIAQLVSELCRREPARFLNHPGPDAIRKKRVRRFILVTDFIGSGKRAETYLEAAWRVRSVRSWGSARKKCGMGFEVLAYSGTERGIARVAAHPSRSAVRIVIPCPTIANSFSRADSRTIEAICIRHAPGRPWMPSLGFDGAGALIAFAHGAPNNTPLILHKKVGAWLPLFPMRITATVRSTFTTGPEQSEDVRQRLIDLRHTRLAKAAVVSSSNPKIRGLVVLMAALGQSPRNSMTIALRTGLTLAEVDGLLLMASKNGWTDGRNRLTDVGHAELHHLKGLGNVIVPLPTAVAEDYCPFQLRAPAGAFS
jgi:hypothetical protein